MARLPHATRAILDIAKLEQYCLAPSHPRGRHKARVFRAALGIDASDAAWLRDALLTAVRQVEATEIVTDQFGTQWQADLLIQRQKRRAVVRTIWIVRVGESLPRFVTCWVV